MGCDIHEYVEVNIGGKWIYIGGIVLPRNYLLFSVLADVRNYDNVECVTGDHRGLPEDIDPVLEQMSEEYGSDGHSHSYLYPDELDKAEKIYYSHADSANRDWPECLRNLRSLTKMEGINDVRFVFWFDN